jgi:hypothetical protein
MLYAKPSHPVCIISGLSTILSFAAVDAQIVCSTKSLNVHNNGYRPYLIEQHYAVKRSVDVGAWLVDGDHHGRAATLRQLHQA